MTSGYQLGIDLGTTYTAAAIGRNGSAEITTLGATSPTMPSVVLLRSDGEVLIGDVAVRRGRDEPTRVAREFKRRLGDPTPLVLGSTPFGAETLMGHLLRGVIATVAEQEGEPPARVVLTCPASYGPYKIDQMRAVVRAAGRDLTDTDILTEPQAAAISYARRNRVQVGEIVAVYDFGGGTLDVALVQRDDTGFRLIGRPDGIERFGGIDVDAAILAFVDQQLDGAITRLDPSDPEVQASVGRLRDDCRAAKEALSTDTDTSISVVLPGVQTKVRLTRRELYEMIRPRLIETIEVLERTVRAAGLEMDQIGRVLLVGGSSRIPLVAELVQSRTGRSVALDAHPKHAIALGAALYVAADAAATAPADPARPVAGVSTAPMPAAAAPAPQPGAPTSPVPFTPTPAPVVRASRANRVALIAGGAVAAVVALGVLGLALGTGSSDDSTAGRTTEADGGETTDDSIADPATTLAVITNTTPESTTPANTLPATAPADVTEPSTPSTDVAVGGDTVDVPTVGDGELVDLGSGVQFHAPADFTVSALDGEATLENPELTVFVRVVATEPDTSLLDVAQPYLDASDAGTAAASYSPLVPTEIASTSDAMPHDAAVLAYRLDDPDQLLNGTLEVHRRGDGLTYLVDVYYTVTLVVPTAFSFTPVEFASESRQELLASFLAAPAVGPIADLSASERQAVTSVHEAVAIDEVVTISPPSDWTIDEPGPGRVVFSGPEGQRFVAQRLDAEITDVTAAYAAAGGLVGELFPGASPEPTLEVADFNIVAEVPSAQLDVATGSWTGTDPNDGSDVNGWVSVWYDGDLGVAYIALSSWQPVGADPPRLNDDNFLMESFYLSASMALA